MVTELKKSNCRGKYAVGEVVEGRTQGEYQKISPRRGRRLDATVRWGSITGKKATRIKKKTI